MHSKQPHFPRLIDNPIAINFLMAFLFIGVAAGQTAGGTSTDTTPVRTFYLNSGASLDQSNEVLTGLRLMLEPSARVYLLPSEDAIVVRGTSAQIELAGKLIADMNHPQKNYKLTYTVTEMDAGKRVGVEHYTLMMSTGGRTTLKQGSKVPIVTGSIANSPGGNPNTQFTFVDVGINLEATLNSSADGLTLQSKLEQSGVIEDKAIAGISEPVIRQTLLRGTSLLQPGKPLMLGSLDVPGSTRHLDVEVVLEPLP